MFAAVLTLAFLVDPDPSSTEWFDPAALPTVTLDDLDRFHDAVMAIHHNASPTAIEKYVCAFAQRWWDNAGFAVEYESELKRLKWVQRCWSKLEDAQSHHSEEYRTWAMIDLRKMLGPQMYYAGRMPAYPIGAMQWTLPKPKDKQQ